MLTWLIRRRIAAFERSYDYDMSHMRALLAADPRGFRTFMKATGLIQYDGDLVPPAPLCAARLASTMAEDCGPCTQVGVRLAQAAGIAPAILRAIVAGDLAAMPRDVALAYRFATLSLAHDPAADDVRDEIRTLWGERGVATLSLAIVAGRLYPTLKYAMGFGQSCQRVTVADEVVIPARVRNNLQAA